MPYYITNSNPNCPGWAVMAEGDAEKIFGCHASKQDAIDQAVAVSLADDEEFIGERDVRVEGGPEIGVSDIDGTLLNGGNLNETVYAYILDEGYPLFVVTGRPESERDATIKDLSDAGVEFAELIMNPGSTSDSPAYKKETMSGLLEKYDVKYAIENDETTVGFYRDLGVETFTPGEVPAVEESSVRVDVSVPQYMRDAADQGLKWFADGLAGDGLTSRTVNEARDMARGVVSEDKWVRIAAWLARHEPDLNAPAADPTNEGYPSPGVVAHALWGSMGGVEGSRRVQAFAEEVVAKIKSEESGMRSMTTVETRVLFNDFEVRETADGMTLTGYAARFNEPSEPLPFIERIAPGAFRRSLRSKNDIKLLWNHDSSTVLGSTRSKTLRLFEDEQGLRVEATLPDTTAGRDAKVLIQRGDVTGFSFGFTVPKGGDSWNNDGSERTLRSVRLHEVSVGVAFPAYSSTNGTAQVRSLDKLATRAEVDADALASAFEKLENGDDITADERDLLTSVIEKLSPADELDAELLALKKKKLELLKIV